MSQLMSKYMYTNTSLRPCFFIARVRKMRSESNKISSPFFWHIPFLFTEVSGVGISSYILVRFIIFICYTEISISLLFSVDIFSLMSSLRWWAVSHLQTTLISNTVICRIVLSIYSWRRKLRWTKSNIVIFMIFWFDPVMVAFFDGIDCRDQTRTCQS